MPGYLPAGASRNYIMEMNLALQDLPAPNDGHVRQIFPEDGHRIQSINFQLRAAMHRKKAYGDILQTCQFSESSSALTTGKMMQYVPEDGVYVYFRYDNNKRLWW